MESKEQNNQALPIITLSCSYDIYAAHQLFRKEWPEAKNREVFGHCADLHGHQYKLNVILKGAIDPDSGMLLNGYAVDAIIKEKIMAKIDHKFINDADDFFKTHLTTVEWISYWAYQQLKDAFPANCQIDMIEVYETPGLVARYKP